MSASKSKKERKADDFSGMTMKQRQDAVAAKKSHRNAIIYTIIGIVVAICVIALLVWDNGVIQRHTTAVTIGDKSYGVVDVDYYYYSTYSNYSTYASVYGLDTSKSLDEQEIYEGYTWDQMLKDSAIKYLTNITTLAEEAENAGYELSEDGQAQVESALENVATYAKAYNVSEKYYLQNMYGKYMTVSDYRRIITQAQLASEYATAKQDEFEVTDDEIDTYYTENSATLDTIDYTCYLVSFDRTEQDEDGNTVDLDDETIEANRAEAEAHAQEILDALVAGDTDKAAELADTYGATDSSNSSAITYQGYIDWMNDSSHQAGSSDLIENVSSSSDTVTGYYAMYVNSRYLDEYCGANARVIRLDAEKNDDDDTYDMDACEEKAQSLLDEYESGDKTADAFGTLADNNSSDASSYAGGLHENLSKNGYNDEVIAWLFDSDARQSGDTSVFRDDDNNVCYVVYFDSYNETPYWRTVCTSSLQSEKYSSWLEEATANYTATQGTGMSFVG
jgi:hypothetical protein